jgi:hypothetical protein
MRKILCLLALLVPACAFTQSTLNPDTVCYQSTGSVYSVVNEPGTVYTWTVALPGVLVSGQGTNSIQVDWNGANPGTIPGAVSVYPTNSFGCVGPTVSLDLFVLFVAPTVTPLSACLNEPCMPLIGTPAGGTWSGAGVSGNLFCPSSAGVGAFTVTYTYSQAGCTFTATGQVTVNPVPTISPISHD